MTRRRSSGKAGWPLLLPTWAVLGIFFLVPLVLMLGVSFAERGTYGGIRPIDDLGSYILSGDFAGVTITGTHPDHPGWSIPARFYFRRAALGWTLVGVEREN